MRKALIIVISSVLLLTGCSSSMSLEEGVKLAEYEQCLNVRGMLNNNWPYGGLDFKEIAYDKAVEYCAKYKP